MRLSGAGTEVEGPVAGCVAVAGGEFFEARWGDGFAIGASGGLQQWLVGGDALDATEATNEDESRRPGADAGNSAQPRFDFVIVASAEPLFVHVRESLAR